MDGVTTTLLSIDSIQASDPDIDPFVEFDELIERHGKEQRAAEAFVREIIAARPMRAVFYRGDDIIALTPSLDRRYHFRITNFDINGPWGHTEFRSTDTDIRHAAQEIAGALRRGFIRQKA